MTQRIGALLGALMLLSMPLFAQSEGEQDGSEQIQTQNIVNSTPDESSFLIDAGEDGANEGEILDTRTIGFGDVVRMLLVLAAVIGVIYITFSLLKRASRSQVRSSTLIHSLSSVPLGGSRALHLIQVGERHYLIGSGEQNVQLIEAIEDQETIDYIKQNKKCFDTNGC